MWHDIYLLVSILTSYLESTYISIRIINQNMYASNTNKPAQYNVMDYELSLPTVRRNYEPDVPNITGFDPTVQYVLEYEPVLQNVLNYESELKNAINDIHQPTPVNPQYEIPDFSIYFERISEIKCMEYVYQMLKRQESNNLGLSKDVSIINGKVVAATEYPHMGALGWWSNEEQTTVFLCGASLISERFMLTAAHCTYSTRRDLSQPQPHFVRLGSRYLESSPEELPMDIYIKRLLQYPKYKSPLTYYDIALVELSKTVTFSKFIQPICLSSNYHTMNNKKVAATGWGTVSAKSRDNRPSRELRFAELVVIDRQTCNRLLHKYRGRVWRGLQPHQMCAADLNGNSDTCKGDSGGPIQYKLLKTPTEGSIHRLLSITSFGVVRCAQQNVPGVYTNVSYFLDWIEDNVWLYS